jgi:hypothetical protein
MAGDTAIENNSPCEEFLVAAVNYGGCSAPTSGKRKKSVDWWRIFLSAVVSRQTKKEVTLRTLRLCGEILLVS